MMQMSVFMMAAEVRQGPDAKTNTVSARRFAACDEFYKDAVFDDWLGMDWLAGAGSRAEKLRKELERLEMRACTGVY